MRGPHQKLGRLVPSHREPDGSALWLNWGSLFPEYYVPEIDHGV